MKIWKILLILILGLTLIIICFIFLVYRPSKSTLPAVPLSNVNNLSNPPAQIGQAPIPPTKVAENFYKWYLQNLKKNSTFTSLEPFKTSLSQWVTPEFIAAWSTTTQVSNIDPVLLSQDYQDSWVTTIKTQVIEGNQTTSTVVVSLGSEAELNEVLVHLIFINNKWIIFSIARAPKH
jgi:hypothetical protein